MCKDCGCSITDHHHHHDHDHDDHHHHHHDERLDTVHANPQLNDKKTVAVITKILDKNDTQARHNREHFDEHKVLAINLMSSPGSGKTTLLQKLQEVANFKYAVIEGDLETSRDADRLKSVGNLVCPASYDVGTHLNIVLVSVPEGNDKIAKYPVMFRSADLVLITKTDLLPHFEYDIEAEKKEARRLKPNVDIIEVNIKDMDTVKKVADWISFKIGCR